MIIHVRLTPKSHKNVVEGFHDGILHVRVRAVPEKGKANAALIEVLAKHFSVAKSQVEIVSGFESRNKRIRLVGLEDNKI